MTSRPDDSELITYLKENAPELQGKTLEEFIVLGFRSLYEAIHNLDDRIEVLEKGGK